MIFGIGVVFRFIGYQFVDNPEHDEELPSCESCFKNSSRLIKALFRYFFLHSNFTTNVTYTNFVELL